VACGENKAISIKPPRRARAVRKASAKKSGTDLGGTERKTKVAGIAFMDGVHGEAAGFMGGFCEELKIKCHRKWSSGRGEAEEEPAP
jgi:hypothetical protein